MSRPDNLAMIVDIRSDTRQITERDPLVLQVSRGACLLGADIGDGPDRLDGIAASREDRRCDGYSETRVHGASKTGKACTAAMARDALAPAPEV